MKFWGAQFVLILEETLAKSFSRYADFIRVSAEPLPEKPAAQKLITVPKYEENSIPG